MNAKWMNVDRVSKKGTARLKKQQERAFALVSKSNLI